MGCDGADLCISGFDAVLHSYNAETRKHVD